MKTQPELDQFFSDPEKPARVQKYQVDYWIDFFRVNINDSYVARRRVVGDAHTRIGLPLHSYLAAMNLSLKLVTETLYDRSLVEGDYTTKARAVTKLVHLDTSPRSSMYWVMVKRLMSWWLRSSASCKTIGMIRW